MLNVHVYDSSVRNRQNEYEVFERVARRRETAHLRPAKVHHHMAQDVWNDVVWTNEIKWRFGPNAQRHTWRKLSSAYQHEYFIPTVKHSSEGVMFWACCVTTSRGHLALIELTMSSSEYFRVRATAKACHKLHREAG